jgi:uroporphyrinogen III methyltransferase / synthase
MGVFPGKLKVAARGSPLARQQCEEAAEALKAVLPAGTGLEFVHLETPGDRDQAAALGTSGVPDDFFTRDLDDALRRGEVDLVIHSAKDLPQNLAEGIATAALLRARDIRDALVLRRGMATDQPPHNIGTSSPRREEEIRRLFPRSKTRPIRGTIGQRIEKLDRGEYDAIIVAACALKRLGLEDRISEYLPYDPVPQQGRLAITIRSDGKDLLRLLKPLDVRRSAGLVAIVGCPADEALLSKRAETYLRLSDLVLHDRLIPDAVLLSIRHKALSVGKSGGHPSVSQADIHRTLLEQAELGKLVVRLHGGEPGIYGHLSEELEFLAAWNIRADVVPAVSAVQVAAARAGASLTHRGSGRRVSLVSAHESGDEHDLPGPSAGNLAVYMGAKDILSTAEGLRRAGWPEESGVIVGQRLGYRDESVVHTDLRHVNDLPIGPPAVFLLGTRAFPPRETTLFVGTDPEHFLVHGPLIHFPLIRLVARPIDERLRCLRERLDTASGVIFPSRFAVRTFVQALMAWKDVRALSGKVLLAVGPATAEELANSGLRADETADGLAGVRSLAGKIRAEWAGTFLYPCSDAAPVHEREERLKSHGVSLSPCIFYVNRRMPIRNLPSRPFSRVLFTSGSTVRTYFENYAQERHEARTWLAVGPSTLEALEALGLEADAI